MTKLRIYKGKTWQPPDVRDELCSILVGIEQATAGCHRFLFAEAEASLDFESRRRKSLHDGFSQQSSCGRCWK
jgi:hypothetical protein